MNASTGELIGDFLEEQLVRVVRGKRVSAKFDMRPKEASIEISVLGAAKGEKGSEHVAVALRGNPSSLRYVGDAPVFLYVKPGRYVLLVGAGDRLLERVVEVKTFDPVKVVVDVARDAGGALFSGSAAAVKAFLEGDLSRAAEELERAGQTQAATKLRADLLQKRGDVAGASRALETAGDLRGAAELRAKTEDRAGAAALFEAAGELDKAGDAYRAAGDMAAAARAYERAGELDQAIECCKETQDTEHLLALLREERVLLRRRPARRQPAADQARDPQPVAGRRAGPELDRGRSASWSSCRCSAASSVPRSRSSTSCSKRRARTRRRCRCRR